MRILLIEDHSRLADSITKGLAGLGFGVDPFPTAGDGLNAFKSVAYDAIILDLGLPDRDGIDVLCELRQLSSSAPILILTARDSVDARVTGLDTGADDYVVKPFAMTELAARLRALLRRPGQALGSKSRYWKLAASYDFAPGDCQRDDRALSGARGRSARIVNAPRGPSRCQRHVGR